MIRGLPLPSVNASLLLLDRSYYAQALLLPPEVAHERFWESRGVCPQSVFGDCLVGITVAYVVGVVSLAHAPRPGRQVSTDT